MVSGFADVEGAAGTAASASGADADGAGDDDDGAGAWGGVWGSCLSMRGKIAEGRECVVWA